VDPTLPPATLLLGRSHVRRFLTPERAHRAAREAFLALGSGRVPSPAALTVDAGQGGFHVKAGLWSASRRYFVAKTNGNFMANRDRHGLPTILGTVQVSDAETGCPLALLDSIEITVLRTAAATAVAAELLAPPESRTLAVIGCGAQGAAHVEALRRALPLRRAVLHDRDPERARALAGDLEREGGLEVTVAASAPAAAIEGDVCVTCTPSTEILIGRRDVRPGSFVAGIGADAVHKQELAPELLASATVVVDLLRQCAVEGDLHHAIEARAMSAQDVRAELGDIVAGRHPGRTSPDETIVLDSTGIAVLDASAAAMVYEEAVLDPDLPRFEFAR